jgi:hypothetical protein
MRPIETNEMDLQWRTLVIGGSVYLAYQNYESARPTISLSYFPATGAPYQQFGRFTLIRATSFIYQPTSTVLAPGTNLLPYFQVSFGDSGQAIQSFSLDATGGNAILVTRPKAT